MTTQAYHEVIPQGNQHVGTMASSLRDLRRMIPPTFYGSKVEEDTQEFIDETYKILYDMGLTTSEKDELATCQLKDVAKNWYIQWRDNRPLIGGSVTWDIFKKTFCHDRGAPPRSNMAYLTSQRSYTNP